MRLLLSIFLLSTLTFTSSSADAKRAGTWQVSLTPQFISGQKLNYENGDFIDLASRTGWGFPLISTLTQATEVITHRYMMSMEQNKTSHPTSTAAVSTSL